MFSKVITYDYVLKPGNRYVFTFSSGRWFEYQSEDWVLQNLRERMANYGYIVSVRRPLFSDRYTVVVIPTTQVRLADWLESFDVSWRDMGYNSYSFILAEEGAISTQPGGIEQTLPSFTSTVGETVSKTAMSMIKPFLPYILILSAVYIGFKVGVPEAMKYRRIRR